MALKETKCDVHLRVLKTVYNIEVAATEEVEFGDAEYYMQVRFGIRNAQKSYPAWDGYTLPPVAVSINDHDFTVDHCLFIYKSIVS